MTTNAPVHTCHAHGCTKRVSPRMLFCLPHWKRLRKPVQDAIWREYQPGQEQRKTPTARYMAVQRLAVAEVAFRPNDEAAVATAAPYLAEAQRWRALAIKQGAGDPLAGLVKAPPQAETEHG